MSEERRAGDNSYPARRAFKVICGAKHPANLERVRSVQILANVDERSVLLLADLDVDAVARFCVS